MRRGVTLDDGLVTIHKMAVERGWKKIDQHEHELTQTRTYIYMNTTSDKSTTFRCEIGGTPLHTGISVAALKNQIDDHLATMMGIEWRRVIKLSIDKPDKSPYRKAKELSASVGAEIREWMVSTEPVADQYLRAERRDNPEFHTDEQFLKDAKPFQSWRIKDRGKFNPPHVREGGYYNSSMSVWLPYTEEVWATLVLMLEQIEGVRSMLQEFMEQPDVVAQLETMGVPLLAAPEGDSKGLTEITD